MQIKYCLDFFYTVNNILPCYQNPSFFIHVRVQRTIEVTSKYNFIFKSPVVFFENINLLNDHKT